MDSGSAAITAASSAIVAVTAAHKHAKKQETGDTAKSCTTYQNLIFDEGTSRTEPIIICDIEKPVIDKKPDGYTDLTLGIGILGAFIIGVIIGMYIVHTGPRSNDY